MICTFVWLFPLFLLSSTTMTTCAPVDHTGAIQAMPPGVSLSPIVDKQSTSNYFHISPFLSNTLIQAIAEESELKKRVQRYRDIEK